MLRLLFKPPSDFYGLSKFGGGAKKFPLKENSFTKITLNLSVHHTTAYQN
jgi:hypothetical protein